MQRTLLITEIVGQIVDSNDFDLRYLYKCLFISRLFFHSAASILWETCGVSTSMANPVTPSIHHLVQIARADVQRGQTYANHIRSLRAGVGGRGYDENGVVGEGQEGSEYVDLEELCSLGLEWTRLADVDIVLSDNIVWREAKTNIMPFLLGGLRRFSFQHNQAMGDELPRILAERCPALESLVLKPCIGKGGISRDGLITMLSGCEVKSLDIRSDRDRKLEETGWEGDILDILFSQRGLEQISVPDIDDFAIGDIANGKAGYPSSLDLVSFTGKLSTFGLASLHKITPNLSVIALDMRDSPPSCSVFLRPSQFPSIPANVTLFSRLSDLSIELHPRAHLHGLELVRLAEGCPCLSRLRIVSNAMNINRPWTMAIDDAVIDTFARSAIHLKELYLFFRVFGFKDNGNPSKPGPTEQALESLGRHCLRLERLWFTCDPNWMELTKSSLGVLFPKVWDLQLAAHTTRESDLGGGGGGYFAKRMAARCPNLIEFWFVPPRLDKFLDKRVRDILGERRSRSSKTLRRKDNWRINNPRAPVEMLLPGLERYAPRGGFTTAVFRQLIHDAG